MELRLCGHRYTCFAGIKIMVSVQNRILQDVNSGNGFKPKGSSDDRGKAV